jgi:hypothetical protein
VKDRRDQCAKTPTIAASTSDDHQALGRGMAIFDALYRSFESGSSKS